MMNYYMSIRKNVLELHLCIVSSLLMGRSCNDEIMYRYSSAWMISAAFSWSWGKWHLLCQNRKHVFLARTWFSEVIAKIYKNLRHRCLPKLEEASSKLSWLWLYFIGHQSCGLLVVNTTLSYLIWNIPSVGRYFKITFTFIITVETA